MKLSDENSKMPPAERLAGFKGELACLSCHHDHRGRQESILAITADAGSSCTFCHHHESIEGETRHEIKPEGMKPITREYVGGRQIFKVFGSAKPFTHASHLADFRKDVKGMENLRTLPCQFCHVQAGGRTDGVVEFGLVWATGDGAQEHGCGVHGCHDQAAENDLASPASMISKAAQYRYLVAYMPLNTEFHHSPGHLRYECVDCHQQMEKSKNVARKSDPAMQVRNCFSCHEHEPSGVQHQTPATVAGIQGIANAADLYSEDKIVDCNACHVFHAKRTSHPWSDFTKAPLLEPTHPPENLTLTAYTFGMEPPPGAAGTIRPAGLRWSMVPLLGFVALALGSVTGAGFARWFSRSTTAADETGSSGEVLELAYHHDNYETNIGRLYVVGEVAGIASINMALRSGREAVEGIASQIKLGKPVPEAEAYDIAIIGCGPAGLGAATTAKAEKLSYVVLERMTPASSIRDYPRNKFVQAAPIEIREYGSEFLMETDNTKLGLIQEWERVIAKTRLEIRERSEVVAVQRNGELFDLKTAAGDSFKSRYVVVAIGVRGAPRRLGVPGETLDRVFYKLIDEDEFQHKRILVVGGGNAGAEVAQALANPALQNQVSYSFREPSLSRPSRENLEKISALHMQQRLTIYPKSQVLEIKPGKVILAPFGGKADAPVGAGVAISNTVEIDNDVVFGMLGAVPPPFVKALGIRMIKRGHQG